LTDSGGGLRCCANPFIVYVIACINGEPRRRLRDSSWRVHVSRTLKELDLQVVKARPADRRPPPAAEKGTTSFGALLPAPASEVELEDRLALPALMNGLSELERRAVIMRFFQDLKQTQIGAELGYSQMHVSRVLRRTLAQMREQLAP
jgi:RNA polymerase sigma-B factor